MPCHRTATPASDGKEGLITIQRDALRAGFLMQLVLACVINILVQPVDALCTCCPRRRVFASVAAALTVRPPLPAIGDDALEDARGLIQQLDAASKLLDRSPLRPAANLTITTMPTLSGRTRRDTCWYELAGEWSRLKGDDCARLGANGRLVP